MHSTLSSLVAHLLGVLQLFFGALIGVGAVLAAAFAVGVIAGMATGLALSEWVDRKRWYPGRITSEDRLLNRLADSGATEVPREERWRWS